jgi:hypothetical protein
MVYAFKNNRKLIIMYICSMGAIDLRNKLQELMQYANDMDLANAFDDFVKVYKNDKSPSVLSEVQQKEVDRRRAKYLAGEGKSHTWQEVKSKISAKYGI